MHRGAQRRGVLLAMCRSICQSVKYDLTTQYRATRSPSRETSADRHPTEPRAAPLSLPSPVPPSLRSRALPCLYPRSGLVPCLVSTLADALVSAFYPIPHSRSLLLSSPLEPRADPILIPSSSHPLSRSFALFALLRLIGRLFACANLRPFRASNGLRTALKGRRFVKQ